MRTDDEIRKDVELELKWDVDIDSRDIAVAMRDGVVALTGFLRTVRSWAEREEAERPARLAPGVSRVENHLVVSREASSAPRTGAAQPGALVGSP